MHRTLTGLRLATRLLLSSRAFTLTASLSLAIGIAATTAIFGVADAVLLRERPGVASPERLVDIGRTVHRGGFDTISYPTYLDYRDRNAVFTGVAAYRIEPQPLSLDANAVVDRVFGTLASDSFFSVLGVRPALGRLFVPGEDHPPAASPIAVISHRLWRERFDADRSIIGRTIRLNQVPVTVVGVAEAGFTGTTVLASDVWLPLSMHIALAHSKPEMFTSRQAVWLMAFARMKPGLSPGQAQAAMTTLSAQLAREHPDAYRDSGVRLSPSHRLPGQLRQPVTMFIALLGALGLLILLIACANVAAMLIARSAARRKEMAIRLAIGAARGDIVRQLLTETVLLFLVGGGGGLLGAAWLTSLLRAVPPALPVPLVIDARLDPRALAFGVVISLATGLAFGLLPALQASRPDLVRIINQGGSAPRLGRLRLRSAFVATQVAMSVVLLVAAGLFVRALGHAASIETGFSADRVDAVFLDARMGGYDHTTTPAFIHQVLERLAAQPGVRSVAMAGVLPLGGDGLSFGRVRRTGQGDEADRPAIDADWNVIAGDYFRTLEIPLVRGRSFTSADASGATRVAIINQALAERLWPGEDPVGRVFDVEAPGRDELTVVGVARDAKYRWLGESPRPFVYVPLGQHDYDRQAILLRGSGASTIPAARRVLHDLNASLPIIQAGPLSSYTTQALLPQRVAAWMAGALGLVGLLLSAIGIYGVTAYAAARRSRELGIRVALGAEPRMVFRTVAWQGARLALVGAIIGVAAAMVVSRIAESLLLGVGALDPAAYAGAALGLALTVLAASCVPARSAARRDPLEALRVE